jgi:hypothetical protein
MVFSVLSDLDEDTKDEILQKIINNESLDSYSEYSELIESYRRALVQLSTKNQYDFFKHRKKIDNYIEFSLVDTVSHSKSYYIYKEGKYILDYSRKCPICGKAISEENLEEHIKSDLEKQNKVIVLLDSSIDRNQPRFEFESCTVREIKKNIFDKIGVSVSKLEIYKNETLLGNNEILRNETVTVKQKRRSNK